MRIYLHERGFDGISVRLAAVMHPGTPPMLVDCMYRKPALTWLRLSLPSLSSQAQEDPMLTNAGTVTHPFAPSPKLFEVPDGHGVGVPGMGAVRRGAASSEGGPRTTTVTSEELLGALSEIEKKYAPERLFVAGKIERPLPHPRVAIIGTRTPSPEGVRIASTVSTVLAQRGVIIVSGLARGIDTAAHTAAIEAGGRTIAVLGTPLSQTYPRENAELQSLIMSSHLAVSQFGDGSTVRQTNFLVRNRTMALIADASVIVESGEGGGSLHQGWEALRLGRPLFIHTREFAKRGLDWPRKMAEYGAVQFKDSSDILDFLPSPRLDLAVAAFETA